MFEAGQIKKVGFPLETKFIGFEIRLNKDVHDYYTFLRAFTQIVLTYTQKINKIWLKKISLLYTKKLRTYSALF
jgi:hypothetical protein